MVFNDAGSGFMHGTAWVCPGMNDLLKGVSLASQGYCIVTDKDGDKAFVAWKGRKETEPNKGGGDFQWTGGTGKYTGLKGRQRVHGRSRRRRGTGSLAPERRVGTPAVAGPGGSGIPAPDASQGEAAR